jgi:hypothetical protein
VRLESVFCDIFDMDTLLGFNIFRSNFVVKIKGIHSNLKGDVT